MKPNIGIPENHLKQAAEKLNILLADETILYTKTRNYHWNYEGDNFMEMHKLFEGQYEELAEHIDGVAERIRMLGHHAEGRLKDYIELARLDEPAYTTKQDEQVGNLVNDHETLANLIRKDIDAIQGLGDTGTADFLTGLLRFHEQKAWMLRSYLK